VTPDASPGLSQPHRARSELLQPRLHLPQSRLQLPRRRFLRGLGLAGLSMTAACAGPRLAPVPLPGTVSDRSRAERMVRFANWIDYIDQAPSGPRRHPTLAEFTRRTGIAVEYSEPISGNEQFLGQIGIALALGRGTGYDLIVLSDWVVAELIGLGWAEPLSAALTPNARRLLPVFRDWPVPDIRRYSLPWQAGFTGIGYNLDLTHRPVTSMLDLLTAPDLRGKVALVEDFRDVMGCLMLDLGIDPASFSQAEFTRALAVLGRAVRAGQVAMVSNYYYEALARGTIAASVAWAGDVLAYQPQAPSLRFAWPAAGGMIWTDNMVIPAQAIHRENAERLMNFYYESAIAAQLTVSQEYLCPVLGTQAVMRRLDPGLAGQPYIFATPEVLQNAHFFEILSPAQSAAYTARYLATVGL
jgi:spermidine/putrescine transport system substrate-binding protein